MGLKGFNQRKVLSLVVTLALAGAIIAAGIYGPSAWQVLAHQGKQPDTDQVVIQNPPVTGVGSNLTGTATLGGNNLSTGGNVASTIGGNTSGSTTPTATAPSTTGLNTVPEGDSSGAKKYQEPDTNVIDLAPSIAGFFADGDAGLSEMAKTLAFTSAWNIHQYVDGYLFGPLAGPQMNEQDIQKYIVFHKSLWDKQIKKEPGAAKAAVFVNYMDDLFNRGIDAFDLKDKIKINLFHEEIHDLDRHLFRNDPNTEIYGATPFATKR